MSRLGKRAAGDRVTARVQRFSDELLVVEEHTFGLVDGEYAAMLPEAQQAATSSLRRVRGDVAKLRPTGLAEDLGKLHDRLLGSTTGLVAGLGTRAGEMAADSILDELLICEETIAARYRGIASEGVELARESVQELVTEAMGDYQGTLETLRKIFADQVTQQIRFAQSEDQDKLVARLFGTEVRLPGISGRGAWWRGSTVVKAAARSLGIRVANAVRGNAMQGMNEAYARR